ncbi:uncharacterized protein LOC122508768 isoform X2 [Leptopilina heterotoma]|uniref:uncharacterized protein LOC122508768 isoform X2 n=1 Tax=Leptopilina heterotoma TaxID=63436 RepID=UPI001CA93670|nr:uncharacterized protein LOC122508768 isoform X2 [Leptopilina heterotoma]
MSSKSTLLFCCLISIGIAQNNLDRANITTTTSQKATDNTEETSQNGIENYLTSTDPASSTNANGLQNQNINDSIASPANLRIISTNIWDVKKFNYLIIDETTNVPCILTTMNITLTIPYKTKENKIDTKKLTVPLKNVNVSGTCKEDISVLTLMWQESEELSLSTSDGINEVTMNIVKVGDIHYVQYLIVSIALDDVNFPNAAATCSLLLNIEIKLSTLGTER